MDLQQEQWWNQFLADENGVLLDVRTDEEVEEVTLDGAQHFDFYQGQDFLNHLQALDKSKNYYVYCRSGGRSGQTCLLMTQLGFENTYNLIGGMNDWQGPIKES